MALFSIRFAIECIQLRYSDSVDPKDGKLIDMIASGRPNMTLFAGIVDTEC